MTETDRYAIPVTSGAIAGAGAWVIGYLLAYIVAVDDVRRTLEVRTVRFLPGDMSRPELVGWLFYNAHGVEIRYPGGEFGPPDQNFLAMGGGRLSLLYLIPPVFLTAAGAFVTWRRRADLRITAHAIVSGASVFVGYVLFVLLGLAVFAVDVGQESIRPNPVDAVFLAGLVYPIVFGAIGGVLVRLAVGLPSTRA